MSVAAFVAISQIGCPPLKFYGIRSPRYESTVYRNLECNNKKICSLEEYQPICSVDGETHFLSPCQAGCRHCKTKPFAGKNITLYKDCSCVYANAIETNTSFVTDWPDVWPDREEDWPKTLNESTNIHYAYSGYCPSNCKDKFFLVLSVFAFLAFLLSTSQLPTILVFMRAVEMRDKTTAFSFTVSFLSLFALIPGPLLYGAIFDSACMVWGEKCGEQLNCMAYDTELLRFRMGVTSVILMSFGFFCKLGIFHYGKNLMLFDDEDDGKTNEMNEEN